MNRSRTRLMPALVLPLVPLAAWWLAARAQEPLAVNAHVLELEAKRIAAVEKVRPAVVAVFARGGRGGGSGVLISADGYALTNFHVVQPAGPVMQCGLADGVLYDAVVVGIDPVGDVALIKLLPKEPGQKFPFAPMGDSDTVKVGDWSIAMGNPFLLATDFTPTVTFGLVSGTHRYQYPAGTILEYTDCIQIDTSINPGNSGGPLFNLDGEIIGINGRGSFEKRGRINSGVGYAISINQIKNFLGHLRAGLVVDHATLGALVKTDEEGRLQVTQILEDSDAYRRGLRELDFIERFAGRPVTTVNQYKNVLGIYPRGWRLPLTYRHIDEQTGESKSRVVLVRLMGATPRVVEEEKPGKPGEKPPPGKPFPGKPGVPPVPADSPAAKLYVPKPGYANHYFNKLERQRLYEAFRKHGDFAKLAGGWSFAGEMKQNAVTTTFDDRIAKMKIGQLDYQVEPLKVGEVAENLREPRGSGGLLVALYQWRRLLTVGEKGFEAEYAYGGYEPFYPDATPQSRVETEVLNTEHAGVVCKWFFSRQDQTLLGMECYIEKDGDPCEITFLDYKDVNGRRLPHRLVVRYQDREYATFIIKSYTLAEK